MPDAELEKLIESLTQLKVSGPSRGGPHVGISHNEVTMDLVRHEHRKKVIAKLIHILDRGETEARVYAVFVLGELRAREARANISAIEHEQLEESAGVAVGTLRVQAKYALEKIDGSRQIHFKP